MNVSVVTERDEFRALSEQIADVSDHADVANCFYEPWMLEAALDLEGDEALPLFVVVRDVSAENMESIIGFFPLMRGKRYSGLPIPHLRFWRYEHCFFCGPLIRKGRVREVVRAFMDWWHSSDNLPRMLVLNHIDGESEFAISLRGEISRRGVQTFESFAEHVLIEPADTFDEYERKYLSKNFRKELKRKRRRLEEIGPVEFDFSFSPSSPEEWLKEFLFLEGKGWKGKEGTALVSTGENTRFVERIFSYAKKTGRVGTASLRLQGELIAGSFTISAGSGRFACKIAYDEKYGKYSPAILLEYEHLKFIHAQGATDWIDTCVSSESEMGRRIGSGSRPIGDIVLARRLFPEGIFVKYFIPMAQRFFKGH